MAIFDESRAKDYKYIFSYLVEENETGVREALRQQKYDMIYNTPDELVAFLIYLKESGADLTFLKDVQVTNIPSGSIGRLSLDWDKVTNTVTDIGQVLGALGIGLVSVFGGGALAGGQQPPPQQGTILGLTPTTFWLIVAAIAILFVLVTVKAFKK